MHFSTVILYVNTYCVIGYYVFRFVMHSVIFKVYIIYIKNRCIFYERNNEI